MRRRQEQVRGQGAVPRVRPHLPQQRPGRGPVPLGPSAAVVGPPLRRGRAEEGAHGGEARGHGAGRRGVLQPRRRGPQEREPHAGDQVPLRRAPGAEEGAEAAHDHGQVAVPLGALVRVDGGCCLGLAAGGGLGQGVDGVGAPDQRLHQRPARRILPLRFLLLQHRFPFPQLCGQQLQPHQLKDEAPRALRLRHVPLGPHQRLATAAAIPRRCHQRPQLPRPLQRPAHPARRREHGRAATGAAEAHARAGQAQHGAPEAAAVRAGQGAGCAVCLEPQRGEAAARGGAGAGGRQEGAEGCSNVEAQGEGGGPRAVAGQELRKDEDEQVPRPHQGRLVRPSEATERQGPVQEVGVQHLGHGGGRVVRARQQAVGAEGLRELQAVEAHSPQELATGCRVVAASVPAQVDRDVAKSSVQRRDVLLPGGVAGGVDDGGEERVQARDHHGGQRGARAADPGGVEADSRQRGQGVEGRGGGWGVGLCGPQPCPRLPRPRVQRHLNVLPQPLGRQGPRLTLPPAPAAPAVVVPKVAPAAVAPIARLLLPLLLSPLPMP